MIIITRSSVCNVYNCRVQLAFRAQDSDLLSGQQRWLHDMHRVRANLDTARREHAAAQRRIEGATAEAQLLRVTSEQKDAEIARLQELVMCAPGGLFIYLFLFNLMRIITWIYLV